MVGSLKLLYSQYLAENEKECSFSAFCKCVPFNVKKSLMHLAGEHVYIHIV